MAWESVLSSYYHEEMTVSFLQSPVTDRSALGSCDISIKKKEEGINK